MDQIFLTNRLQAKILELLLINKHKTNNIQNIIVK